MGGHAAWVVLCYNRADGKIYILDCINMADPTPQKIRQTIEDLTIKYSPQEFRVEINAHQKAYSLDSELRNWLASYGVRLDAQALTQQLLTWKPDTRGKTDTVMALWFAVIRLRELMQQSSRVSNYATNRWATRAQMNNRYGVNLDDAFAEQWQEQYG
jgi:hypothetical protein